MPSRHALPSCPPVMPSRRDPYLTRVNRAIKDLGCAVAIEVSPSGKRLRLRATLPLPDGSYKQSQSPAQQEPDPGLAPLDAAASLCVV